VAASPTGPLQVKGHPAGGDGGGQVPQQGSEQLEQAAGLGDGQGDLAEVLGRGRVAVGGQDRVVVGAPVQAGDHGEQVEGGRREHDVSAPGAVAAGLRVREIAAGLGMTQKAAHAVLRVSFAKVAEYQQRGLVHFHAVIRLDGPDGNSQPPPPYATVAVLTKAARAAAARVRVTVESDAVGERELGWGEQFDVREIASFGTDAEFTDRAVAAYVAKYATKSADASGTLDRALFCRPCQGRGATLLPHGTPLPCTACDGTGQARPLSRLAIARHVRRMIRTCWEMGNLPEFAHLKLRKWAHMLGFRGHFSTKSRSYSTTLGALRDARRVWRTEQARAHSGLPESDPTTTLVVGHWDYLGSGYSPGGALLAAHVRRSRELERQFAAEGGC
jgi:hypothetical protein